MSDLRRNTWARTPRPLLAAGLEVIWTMAAVTATAAPNDATPQVLEEVVVTAQKRVESLHDVPLSLSVVTNADIQLRGLTQFGDYLNSIPGVYFQDGGPGDSIVHIRGLTESGVGSTVATYFGEALTSVFTNHGGKPNLRLVDIDRVEVLRGPQGTVFGADTLAGVLRIMPAAPDLTHYETDVDTRGFATAHSDSGSYHVEGVINMPLIADSLALRLVGYKDDIAGYIDNIVPPQPADDYSVSLGLAPGTVVTPAIAGFTHKDINRESVWGTRASLRWQPLDGLRFDFMYTLQDDKLFSEPFTDPAAGPYRQSRALDAFASGGYGERVDIKTLEGTYDLGPVSLVSISNWMQMRRYSDQDITYLGQLDYGAPIPWSLADNSLGRVFTQEVRVQSRGAGKLQWTLGGFYLHQYANLGQYATDYSCPLCLPVVMYGQTYSYNVPAQTFSDQEQRSLFGTISYEFLPHWTIGLGGRYLREEIRSFDPASSGLLAGGDNPAGPVNRGSVHAFNPSEYVRYEPTKDLMFYFQASRGFRSGDVNDPLPAGCAADAARAGLQPVTRPDTLRNYELGMKAEFAEHRFGLNAAIYKDRWSGVQLSVALNCAFTGIVNSGDINGRGVELELVAQPSPAWRLNLSLAYNQNKFDDVNPGTGFSPGERLPDSPQQNGSAGAQYNYQLGAAWSGFARADLVYVGAVHNNFSTLTGGQLAIIDKAYAQGNLRLGFQQNTLSVELFAQNVTDKRGVSSTDNPAFGGHQTLIRPREVGVELRYAFR
jgi:outer membrane receptor protein involved in Fe transport